MRARAAAALAALAALASSAVLGGGQALPLSTVELKAHNPVLIEGDADWCDRVNGQGLDDDGVLCRDADGTPARPYRIRGWKFNLAASGPGTPAIAIRNTTKAWVVEYNWFTDTQHSQARDGLVLAGASDSKGLVQHNRFEYLRHALVAKEWFHSQPCQLPQGGTGHCMWRRVSAPDVLLNQFKSNAYALMNGPQLGFPSNEATGEVVLNNLDASAVYAYLEVLPTTWKPPLARNWWGSPAGPGMNPAGASLGGGRFWAQCAQGTAAPLGLPPACATPWLAAPYPTAGPVEGPQGLP